MNQVIDYIMSLTNLYGLVHKDKVLEICNIQNDEKIDLEVIDKIMKEAPEMLAKNFVEINGDYFVSETIMEFDEFETQLMQRKGKPFYIPKKEELLKYKNETYFEVPKEYEDLLSYIANNLTDGDEHFAEILCEDIQGICQFAFSVSTIFDIFNRNEISFKSEKQISELMELVMKLANNTRLWENNGHTPNEIFEKIEKPNLRPLPKERFPGFMNFEEMDTTNKKSGPKKVGRNEPCPCDSGKKYKKCCGK
ncbi:SEC-C domain-containing protein [Alkalicella caledoniensis]|uniref:SEC-C domain-containing protein n=1 Tax=Alkalicella caledoniensis TaxID=2731377 RepID=A0A7G9W3N5_ALKCA|nr:SEC-C metal-binding domain-containing protein [Alkalicella caledoniensis]QNO13297.1 SEC-C domain-containing protein [Alkalicella caledoniensis]